MKINFLFLLCRNNVPGIRTFFIGYCVQFIPEPDLFLETRHDLLMEIDRGFREANIEIAFPQQDIHIRNMPDQFSIASKSDAVSQAKEQELKRCLIPV